LDKLFQSTRRLGRDALWDELLRLSYIVTLRTHLYVLLHERILMVLEFILHSLRATSILRSVVASYLLWSNYCLNTTFSDCGSWPLVINSCHVLIGWTVCSRDLLILHHLMLLPLSLLPFEAALLLYIHLHRGVVVRIIWIKTEAISWRNISTRVSTSTRQYGSVAWRCTITITVSGSADPEVGIFNINSL
jgi:hypothetical protein